MDGILKLLKSIYDPGFQQVQWSITGHCNARCRHCYISESQHTHKDLTTEEMIHILDALAEKEVQFISITGGEPLIRQDLPILLDEMVKRNQKITALSTNGFLLDDRMISLFKRHGMQPKVQISFDGIGHHDWMRGINGAERMATEAIDACLRNGLYCCIAMCLHKENVHLLVPTVKFAIEHGVSLVRTCSVGDYGGFKENEGMTLFDKDEIFPYYLDAVPEILKLKSDINIEFCGFLKFSCKSPENYQIIPMIHNCTDTKNNRVCNSIRHSFYISDEGRMIPCMALAGSFIEKDMYKLTEHSIDECVQSPTYQKFLNLQADELIRRNPQCAKCEYLSYCGCGCRGGAITLAEDFYGIEPLHCVFFKNHWVEKIKKAMENYLNNKM